jgi:glycerol-3-phosphate acyltransferase PlsY
VPTGYWLGLAWKRIDVRKEGSGNLGATNVFRVLGWQAGALTLVIDVLKGFVPVRLLWGDSPLYRSLLATRLFHPMAEMPSGALAASGPSDAALIVGLGAILGHTFSLFVRFRGGKGVATSAGVFAALLPGPTGIAVGGFAATLLLTRIVSMSSIVAVILLAGVSLASAADAPLKTVSVAVPLLIIWKHRANILRLRNGTEPRLSFAKRESGA